MIETGTLRAYFSGLQSRIVAAVCADLVRREAREGGDEFAAEFFVDAELRGDAFHLARRVTAEQCHAEAGPAQRRDRPGGVVAHGVGEPEPGQGLPVAGQQDPFAGLRRGGRIACQREARTSQQVAAALDHAFQSAAYAILFAV